MITTFDVVHDAVDPLGLLRSIRDALRPGGRYLCLEINCSDRAAANTGPAATLLYGFSVLYCMTTSLAEGGEGLGTLGLPEPALRGLAAKAGFAQVRLVEMDNPFIGHTALWDYLALGLAWPAAFAAIGLVIFRARTHHDR